MAQNSLFSDKFSGNPIERTVNCIDLASAHMDSFHFNSRVFLDKEDFNMTSYSTIISPLVKKTALGHNTLVIFGGPASLGMDDYLLSSLQTRGVLAQATSQLLSSIPMASGGKKDGSVTLSWYKVGCDPDETVTDILKSASAGSDATKEVDAMELHVRELDAGRGTAVPGLWEVELSASGDVDAVMSHVQRICPLAEHSSGAAHTIVQLAVVSEKTKQGTRGISNSNDLAGMGKITFVLLSNLEGNLMPSWASSDYTNVLQRYPWAEALSQLLQWIESKHATASLHRDSASPFQKSRLCLILNDTVRAYQDAALLLMLKPSEESISTCHQWLQLAENISSACSYCVAANKASDTAHENGGVHRASARRTTSPFRGPSPDKTTANFRSTTPSAGNFDYTHPDQRQKPATEAQTLPPRTTPLRSGGSKPHSLLPSSAHASPAQRASSTSLKSGVAQNSSRYQSPAGKPLSANQLHDMTSPPAEGTTEVETYADARALTRAREEVATLTQALAIKNEQLQQSKQAYDTLIKELQEEGSTLKAKDRERLKQVLAELRDYEIYRDVMETALTRMQAEVEALQNENKQLKVKIQQNDAANRKRDEFKEQYTKDLTTTRKQLADAYERAIRDEAAYKRLAKEKDDMRATQTAMKTDRQRLLKDAEAQGQAVADLKKRLVLLEAKEAQSARDLEAQKNAQEKLMDKMMSYQEENELLKAALTEMLEQAAHLPPPPAPETQPESSHAQVSIAPASASANVVPSVGLSTLQEEKDEEEERKGKVEVQVQQDEAALRREAEAQARKAAKHAHMINRRDFFRTAPPVLESSSVAESKELASPPEAAAPVKKTAFSRRSTILGMK